MIHSLSPQICQLVSLQSTARPVDLARLGAFVGVDRFAAILDERELTIAERDELLLECQLRSLDANPEVQP